MLVWDFLEQVSNGDIYVGTHHAGIKKLNKSTNTLIDIDNINVGGGFFAEVEV